MALINCVVYENGAQTASVALGAVAPYLTRPGCLVWAALHDPTEDELETAEKMFGLHELAVEDVRRQHQRPKVEDYANFLFVVMHTVEFDNELTVGELDVFVGGNFVPSVRTGAERSFADVRERVERSPHLLRLGPGFVLYALMDAVVDRYFPVLDHIETDIETVEAQIFSENIPRSSIQELYAVKQGLGVLRHATSPLLEAVTQITSNRGMTLDVSL